MNFLDKRPFYHFSVDDVFGFLFDQSLFSFFKELHQSFGASIDLYLFYQGCTKGKPRTLREAPSWLRFAPHGLDFDTHAGMQTAKEQIEIFEKIYKEIEHFAGLDNLTNILRTHYCTGSKDLCEYLTNQGVEALLTTTHNDRISYCLGPESREVLNKQGFYRHPELPILFLRSHFALEFYSEKECFSMIDGALKKHGFVVLFTHEVEFKKEEIRNRIKNLLDYLHKKGIPPLTF